MSTLGVYSPGTSWLHRTPAGVKLAALLLAAVALVLARRPWEVVTAFAAAAALYPTAGLGLRTAFAQVRPLLWVLAATAVFHLLLDGVARVVVVVGVVATLVLLAGLVTLTTRTTAMVDVAVACCRPLRLLGVEPERVGLVAALGIRSVPVVLALARQVREAQLARGLGASPRAFAVPLVVRTLRHATALGEALAARGLDD